RLNWSCLDRFRHWPFSRDMDKVAFTSNDHFIWTDENPDVELIEPRIAASIDKNWLVYGKQVFGVVLGRRLFALPHVRTRNSVSVTVFRRPTKCFKVDDEYPNIQRTELPRKDRLFIYLAPLFSWTTEPASLFNHTMPYEKLRVCLEYTAQSVEESRVRCSLNRRWIGWNTWCRHLTDLRLLKENERTGSKSRTQKKQSQKMLSKMSAVITSKMPATPKSKMSRCATPKRPKSNIRSNLALP
uniref:Major sperm protein n=1 Tax=Parascaris univalens TaxID=6257 RepID=A0A915BP40_PARUN